MSRQSLNNLGFSAVEGLLVAIALALVTFVGYYVYHTQSQTNAINSSASAVAQSSPAKGSVKKQAPSTTATQNYFTITEWGVRAAYNGTDTLTYKLSSDQNLATVASKQLAAQDADCATEGAGQIERLTGTDHAYEDGTGPTVAQYAQQNPTAYTKVGGYYYQFIHDQGACGPSISNTAQNQANDVVKALVSEFRAE